MKKVRLEAAGAFGVMTDGGRDRDAMLVYAGQFESMDGPVKVTPEAIALLVQNHNAKLAALNRTPKMGDYPPIMLDHSNSARDVVGRLVGPLTQGEHEGTPAIFGKVRILGKENLEKVEDGRWTHLSIGADLETGTMHELTITPFPAAANAALLSKEATMARKKLGSTDAPKGITTGEPKDEELCNKKKLSEDDDEDDETKKLADGEKPEEKLSETEPGTEPKKDEPKEGEQLSDDKDEDDKLGGNGFRVVKQGKFWYGRGWSDEYPNAKIFATRQEAEKVAQEEGGKVVGKDSKDDDLSDDNDADDKFAKMSSGFRSKAAAVRMALRQQGIASRLSALRAEAKITPAEMKKINLAKLAAASDATVDAVLETYKQRQPVIHTGIFGTIKAETAAQLAARMQKKEITKLEAESRERFTSLGANRKTKLGEFPPPTDQSTVSTDKKPVEEISGMSDDEAAFDEFARMIREGRDNEAREMFRKLNQKPEAVNPGQPIAEMSALQSSFDELLGEFDSFVKLASGRKGVKL